jgi:hypothetical protein
LALLPEEVSVDSQNGGIGARNGLVLALRERLGRGVLYFTQSDLIGDGSVTRAGRLPVTGTGTVTGIWKNACGVGSH